MSARPCISLLACHPEPKLKHCFDALLRLFLSNDFEALAVSRDREFGELLRELAGIKDIVTGVSRQQFPQLAHHRREHACGFQKPLRDDCRFGIFAEHIIGQDTRIYFPSTISRKCVLDHCYDLIHAMYSSRSGSSLG